MKKVLFLTVILSLLFAGFAVEAQSGQVVLSADYVRVRSGPDFDFPLVGYVHDNERYTLKARDLTGTWANISYREFDGWVYAQYIEGGFQAIADAPVRNLVPARVVASGLNIRSTDSLSGRVVDKLVRGDKIELVGRNDSGEWVKVRTTDGTEGWVVRGFLNLSDRYFMRLPLLSRIPGVGANVNPQ